MLSDQNLKAIVDHLYETGAMPKDDVLRLMNHLVWMQGQLELYDGALTATMGGQNEAIYGDYYVYRADGGGCGVMLADESDKARVTGLSQRKA